FWLTVPTAKPVVDFHHQVIAHAERTKKTLAQKGRTCRGTTQSLKILLFSSRIFNEITRYPLIFSSGIRFVDDLTKCRVYRTFTITDSL
ncbi:hypothetical protein WMB10_04285, partial [Tetragenococcus halophilus]|uniref:hypothetical protein n=1 Tax=Tetragenococcus halophilus TaxID=51669 RepID=UPI0030C915B1